MVSERWVELTVSTTAGATMRTLGVEESIICGDGWTVIGTLDPEFTVWGLLNSILAYG